jgi:hypothetical protein
MLYCDNEPAVFHASNKKSSVATKNIDIKYYVMKNRIHVHTIDVKHISTIHMLVDLIIKGLPPSIFLEHV